MKIIALADTHIKSGSIDILPGRLIKLLKEADIVIHAGDFIAQGFFDQLSRICRLEAVHGNMDDMSLKRLLPERKILDLCGIKIGIIHEAALSIQDDTGAFYLAREMEVDILVFGHIHKPVVHSKDKLLLCPGSPTAPRLSEPSVIEINIESGKISGKIITLEGTLCESLRSVANF